MTVKAAILFLSLCLPALADLAAGQQAMKNGDYATALNEFLPLAKEGDAIAQFNLGVMYDGGQGVPQDYAEAARWYRKAAGQGNANAQFSLGLVYAKGQTVKRDYIEAYMWLNLAASSTNGDVQTKFVNARELIAKKMSAKQIAEGQRRARDWSPTQSR